MCEKFKCPYCKKEYIKDHLTVHFNKYCQNKGENTLYDFYNTISNGDIEKLICMYNNGYSLNELCQKKDCLFPFFSRRTVEKILKSVGVKIRTIKESTNQTRCRNKYKNTCEEKYGKGVKNVSQSDIVKKRKCETFLKNYGVDNIWKCDWFNDYQTKIMIEKYGKKRISGFDGKTQEEKDIINQKRFETKSQRGQYDSSLEERVERIMKENGIKYKRPWFMYHHPYDFIFGDHKKCLLEINGDYWHANPKIYKETDTFHNGITAKQIWERDAKFKDCLDGTEWKLYYLWEYDIKRMTDDEILKFLLDKLK